MGVANEFPERLKSLVVVPPSKAFTGIILNHCHE